MSIIGNYYWEKNELVEVVIQWGLKSKGETYGGPRNVMIERNGGERVVRPFRGLRVAYHYIRGNRCRWRAIPERGTPEDEAWAAERMLPCGTCGLPLAVSPQAEPNEWWNAHDPCIANLPGVSVACCGHGVGGRFDLETLHPIEKGGVVLDSCYVGFDDGLTVYGNAARAVMEMLGGAPPPSPSEAISRRELADRFIVP